MPTPEKKIRAARLPDDLLPPQVQQQPPVAPLAIPVARPIPVAQPQPLVPQPVWPQPPQPAAQPIPVAPIAVAPIPAAFTPVAQILVAPVSIGQPVDSRPPTPPSLLPLAQPAINQPVSIARAIPLAPPAMPSQVPVAAPASASGPSAPAPPKTGGPSHTSANTGSSMVDRVVRGVPSWLASSILHVFVVVLLSLLTLPTFSPNDTLFIEVAYSEQEDLSGEKLLDLPTLDMPIAESVVLQQLPEVSDPLAAMPILDPSFLGEVAPTEVQAPAIGMALTGREKGMRSALLGKYGGTKATESAVEGGLAWLARNQQRDGSWSLKGPYSEGSPVENPAAATAMALLAFQGAGNTHLGGDYREQVARGWKALLKLQKPDGNFYNGDVPNQQLYTHGQATIAVCELYGMTKDKAFRDPATHAVAFALQAQSPEGGWRYYPGQGSDTSVTGWYVMALQSAIMAGLEVPDENLQRITKYLDSVQLDDGSRYVYQPLQQPTPTMTAEALLCRQYLGWEREDARLLSGVDYVLSHPVDPAENHDVYYWYYATQLTHHMEGEAWDRWNHVMRDVLPKLQVTTGKERGSWEPAPDRWSHLGGRLYTTCFTIYSLEVYYRHLPIYGDRGAPPVASNPPITVAAQPSSWPPGANPDGK